MKIKGRTRKETRAKPPMEREKNHGDPDQEQGIFEQIHQHGK